VFFAGASWASGFPKRSLLCSSTTPASDCRVYCSRHFCSAVHCSSALPPPPRRSNPTTPSLASPMMDMLDHRLARNPSGYLSEIPADQHGTVDVPSHARVFLREHLRPHPISMKPLDWHFEVYSQDGKLYQSEFETDAGGKENYRVAHPIELIIGAGSTGLAGLSGWATFCFRRRCRSIPEPQLGPLARL
jgi:hypothetical protein